MSEPTGAPSPLDRQTASGVGDTPPSSARRDAGGDVRVPDPGAVEVDASARGRRPARAAPRSTSSGWTRPPAKLWVFSTDTHAVATKNGPRSGRRRLARWPPGRRSPVGSVQVRIVSPVIAPWAPSSARAMCAEDSHSTSCADADQRPDGQQVGERPGDGEQRRLEAEQLGDPLLEPVDASGPRRRRRRRPRRRPSPPASRRSAW